MFKLTSIWTYICITQIVTSLLSSSQNLSKHPWIKQCITKDVKIGDMHHRERLPKVLWKGRLPLESHRKYVIKSVAQTDSAGEIRLWLAGFVHLEVIPGCKESTSNGTEVGKAMSPVWGAGFMVEGGHYDLTPNHNSLDHQNVDSAAWMILKVRDTRSKCISDGLRAKALFCLNLSI